MASVPVDPALVLVRRLRWTAAVGQLGVLWEASSRWGLELDYGQLLGLVGLGVGVNVALGRPWPGLRSERGRVRFAVVFDIVLLTAMLGLAGGPYNPFTVLYLVHTALAAAVLGQAWTWAVAALSTGGYALLFLVHRSVPALEHHHPDASGAPSLHLQGMWMGFMLASGAIAFFVARLARELAEKDGALQREAARADRLAALTTFAGGAAHELGSPLATIAVIAKELERAGGEAAEDAVAIRAEVARCRSLLDDLAVRSGEGVGEAPDPVRLSALCAGAVEALPTELRGRVDVDASGDSVRVPPRSVERILSNLVRNGLAASGPSGRVRVTGELVDGLVRLTVADAGEGMTPEVLARAGEPFFTTRPPGQGSGLGLYLARSFASQHGGRLDLRSQPGEGTTVTLELRSARG